MRPIFSQKLSFFKTILKVGSVQNSLSRGVYHAGTRPTVVSHPQGAASSRAAAAASANGKLIVFALATGVAGTSLFYLMTTQQGGSAGKFLSKSGGSLSRYINKKTDHNSFWPCSFVLNERFPSTLIEATRSKLE